MSFYSILTGKQKAWKCYSMYYLSQLQRKQLITRNIQEINSTKMLGFNFPYNCAEVKTNHS